MFPPWTSTSARGGHPRYANIPKDMVVRYPGGSVNRWAIFGRYGSALSKYLCQRDEQSFDKGLLWLLLLLLYHLLVHTCILGCTASSASKKDECAFPFCLLCCLMHSCICSCCLLVQVRCAADSQPVTTQLLHDRAAAVPCWCTLWVRLPLLLYCQRQRAAPYPHSVPKQCHCSLDSPADQPGWRR